ncbi:MAG: histidine kinase N-terminal 7TM domain-containing protein [Actinomycetota bacterium]
MDSWSSYLLVALVLGALVYVGVAAYVWRHRRAVGGRALTVMLLSACVWTVCYAAEVGADTVASTTLWADLKYVGIVLLPPSLLAFSVEYSGRRRRIGRRTVAVLLVEPLVVLAALAVPATRHLVRSIPTSAGRGAPIVVDVGPIFWVHLAYSYLMLLVGFGLLAAGLLRVSRRYLRQALTLAASALLPFVLNAGFNLGVPGLRRYDLTPIGFSVTGFVLVWGFFRFRLLDLLPVGRRHVVDRLPDAVLVLDAHGRVVDANPAAAALVGQGAAGLVGQDLVEVLPELAALLAPLAATSAGSSECRVERDGGALDLVVSHSPLPDEVSTPTGRLVVVRDVTAAQDADRRLRELLAERTATIATLQRGLYPSRLPLVPGVDVAAVLSPAETDTNVGGDFVDVRAGAPGRWTLMVGDVVGKGAGAATLTAVARHTTLALSALGWAPSVVLQHVSRAITAEDLGQDDPRFATMALATLEPTADGASVVLALGGHPRPLLLTARGEVTEVGVPGHLLGVVDEPELHDSPLTLRPGETLIVFTDGVTETRCGDEAFGDQRLVELVATLAGRSAQEVVTTLVREVRAFGASSDSRDDLAVLALVVPPR